MEKILNKTTGRYIESIIDKRFGRLKVLRFDQERFDREYIKGKSTNICFLCKCDCGNVVSVNNRCLKDGTTKSCGCYKKDTTSKVIGKNKVGMKFNKLTAIERIANYNGTGYIYYKCLCDCGGFTYVRSNKFGEKGTKSCGCALSDFGKSRIKYNIGDRVGRLIITHMVRNDERTEYICVCDCGNENVVIPIDSFNNNNPTQSCGCLHSEMVRSRYDNQDIIGKRFNILTVISEDIEKEKENALKNRKVRFWKCKCDCGCYISVATNVINKGKQISCGCCKSKGEYNIKSWLNIRGIEYECEKKFEGLIGVKGGRLSYDFYIPNLNLLIEANGEQHEKPIHLFGGESQYNIQVKHDDIKRSFAKSNSIKLLEIWYYDYDEIENILEDYFEICEKEAM